MTLKPAEKEVVFGIAGSIAAYKTIDIISDLNKKNIGVTCVLTNAGRKFVTKTTLETISGNSVLCEMFSEESPQWDVEHISIAEKADIVVVAPATANVIAKINLGICDDFLTTIVLATKAPILIVPAMNENMYLNPITQKHISELTKRGVNVLKPEKGRLACGKEGIGRFPDRLHVRDTILSILGFSQ